jgi:hypothetical protein
LWATREVGAEVHSVAYVARQLGVAWHTVMHAVHYWGQALITDPARVGVTTAAGWTRPSSWRPSAQNRRGGPARSVMAVETLRAAAKRFEDDATKALS